MVWWRNQPCITSFKSKANGVCKNRDLLTGERVRRGSVGEAMFHDIHGHYCHQSPQPPPQHQQHCNSTSCLRRAAATTELCGGVSPAQQQLLPGAGAIQQQQILCRNLASSTGVKYTFVLSRLCMLYRKVIFIHYNTSSVVVARAAKLHDVDVWYSQPLPPPPPLPTPLRLLLLPGCMLTLYSP